jgi:hypothetical protein
MRSLEQTVTRMFTLMFMCVFGPLIWISAFVALGRLTGSVSGYQRLVELHPSRANPPDNTRVRSFLIGLLGNGMGSVGSDDGGLYLHGGLLGDATYIPWGALDRLMRIGPWTLVRERRSGITLTVPSSLVRRYLE